MNDEQRAELEVALAAMPAGPLKVMRRRWHVFTGDASLGNFPRGHVEWRHAGRFDSKEDVAAYVRLTVLGGAINSFHVEERLEEVTPS